MSRSRRKPHFLKTVRSAVPDALRVFIPSEPLAVAEDVAQQHDRERSKERLLFAVELVPSR